MKEDILEQFPILVHVWGPKLLMALLLLAIFWFASRMVRQAIFAAGTKADLEYPVVRLMAMAARSTESPHETRTRLKKMIQEMT